jgi:hypothetical protein
MDRDKEMIQLNRVRELTVQMIILLRLFCL